MERYHWGILMSMRFEYEITVDDFVAAQLLYYRLSEGRKQIERAFVWIVGGLFFCLVAWDEGHLSWAILLLAAIGIWWIWAGLVGLFPRWWFRRGYRESGLAGKRYRAEVCEEGFEVTGDVCTWRVRWQGAQVKGENKRVFVFYGANTIFIFGKKYLTGDQQEELRRLSGISPTPAQVGSNTG